MKTKLRGVCIGTGYFSEFHFDGWSRIPAVEIKAICGIDEKKTNQIQKKYGIKNTYTDYLEMFKKEQPDFVDIITPPHTHHEICRAAAALNIAIICQKPLCRDYNTAIALIKEVSQKVRFIIHENFRFQPWHREIKRLLVNASIGELHNLNINSRMGDGWSEDCYLSRQPYFRDYERLLIYETGIHFIDVLKYHGGPIKSVYAKLRQLNPVIKGEDCGIMILDFENDAVGLWDANRYNDNNYAKDRFTFGNYILEGTKGTIRLYPDGQITLQKLGGPEEVHRYEFRDHGFSGDSCYYFQKHATKNLLNDTIAETEAMTYITNLEIQEAIYKSSKVNSPIQLTQNKKYQKS